MHARPRITGPRELIAGPLRLARAFTLVEFVIVLAIIATISAIAVPRYQLATARYRAIGAARRLAADIETMRQDAIARSLGQRFRIRSSTTYQLTDNTAGWAAASVRSIDLSSDPYRARFTTTDLGNDGELLFNGYGIPDGAATMTLSSGVVAAQVSVDGQTGAVSTRVVSITAPALGGS
ncbi:MAG: prepilin-type N-terminal cleavage/methylation domain-containing protein [Phycisphaerales bacterium]|nr:prepilin-type N-terminal cleavage/methylation domain-containing protein [Phycisphaerales bacterium]